MAGKKHARAAFVGFLLSSSALIGSQAFADGLSKTYRVTEAPTVHTTVIPDQQMEPMLNVGLSHCSDKIIAGQPVAFRTYWNYDSFIKRAVIQIFDGNDVYLNRPIAEIPVQREGTTSWNVPENGPGRYFYVLKVYGADGSWDRTVPQIMTVTEGYSDIRQLSSTCGAIHRTDYTGCRNIAINGFVYPAKYAEYGVCAAPVTRQPVVQQPAAPIPQQRAPMSRLTVAQGNLLENSGIQVKSECNRASPMLNVGLIDGGGAGAPGEPVTFDAYSNYDAFIQRGEVRIFDANDSLLHAPIAVIPVSAGQPVAWTPSKAGDYEYVYRVYGANNAFDETVRKTLVIAPGLGKLTPQISQDGPIYGEDATRLRNIKISGGTVTVFGQNTAQRGAGNVLVYGQPVRVDQHGDFAYEQIIPAGTTQVPIGWTDVSGQVQQIAQPVSMGSCNWTFVGLGEITVGANSDTSNGILVADGEDFDKSFVNASGSFYLKGKIRGDTILTASLCAVDDDVENILTNLEDKSAEGLLRRIEPNRYYPVYGDDSTIYEDAPTQGRFYVKLENGDNHLMWGNFTTKILDTEYSQIDRGLYGAKANVEFGGTTKFGERRVQLTAFGADPGSVAGREEFRGTGGSVYFLEQQDVTIGSERLRVEVRDQASGIVLETRELVPYIDYEVDYIQGRVILSDPLQSTTLEQNIVRDGSLSGNAVYLVARYEYVPPVTNIDSMNVGGRAKAWLGDYAKIGVTGQSEELNGSDYTLFGVDATLRASESTYLKAEAAQSEGGIFSENTSLDGGYSRVTNNVGITPTAGSEAMAYRVEGAIHSRDLLKRGPKFELSGYYEDREQGFNAPGQLTQNPTTRQGMRLATDLFRDRIELSVDYDETDIMNASASSPLYERSDVAANARINLTKKLSAGIGARYSDRDGSNNTADQLGHRTDIGGEVRYDTGRYAAYLFGQGTASKSDNRQDGDRFGVGADIHLTDKVNVRGEVSDGEAGLGALAEVAWKRDDGEEYYLNYTLDADHSELGVDGTGYTANSANALTVGGRRRFNDSLSVYGEERASFGERRGLTHAYGVDYSPTKSLQIGAGVEFGDIEDDAQRLEREAASASIGYATDKFQAGLAHEIRRDVSATVGSNNMLGESTERDTWITKANVSVDVSKNWRALANIARVKSEAVASGIDDSDFTQGSVAAAYRPTEGGRLNALFRYTYLQDLPPATQVNTGLTDNPGQKSHVLSADANYRISNKLTVGGKYAWRSGEIENTRGSGVYEESTAHLGIVRADLHVVKKWDALLEGRVLQSDNESTQIGALAAIYRHLGKNFKAGVGYNFTDFSDDLTDLTYDDHGVFLNLIAKF